MSRTRDSKAWLWYRKSEQVILGIIGLLALLILWQVAYMAGWINPVMMSSPMQVVTSGIEQTSSGSLWSDFGVTALEFAIAFGMAVVLGVLLGMVMGWFSRAEYIGDPFLWLFYSSPLIAFYPLFVIWFGLGFKTVVLMGFLFAVIPITINTMAGIKGTNPVLIRATRSFGGSSWQILSKVAIPSALPMIVTGWRIGVERALIGVVVGEMFSSNVGLGFRISYFGARLQTANLFVSIVLVVLFGLVLTQLLRVLENRLLNWQK